MKKKDYYSSCVYLLRTNTLLGATKHIVSETFADNDCRARKYIKLFCFVLFFSDKN